MSGASAGEASSFATRVGPPLGHLHEPDPHPQEQELLVPLEGNPLCATSQVSPRANQTWGLLMVSGLSVIPL